MLFLWGDMMKVKLGDIGASLTGNTPKTSDGKNYISKDINFIKPSDIDEDKITNISTSDYFISELAKNDARILPVGSILVTCIGIIGKVGINSIECAFNQQINAIIPDTRKCNNKFLAYAIQFKKNELQQLANAPVVPILNKTQFSNIQICLPLIEKQNKIVAILDMINEIINKRQQQLKKLDELVKSRFIEMFGDVVINSKNWEQTTLKNVAIGKLTYGSGASAINFNGKIRYIRITDISNDGELNDDMKSPSICDNKYLLNDGDILFARSGATVGKTFCFNKKRYGEAIYAGYLIRMIPDKKRVLPIYVFYYTKTDYYISFISKAQKAVAQPNINAQEYGDLKICVPPIELQNQFAAFVKQTDKSKLEIKKSLDKLEILKKSLMQEYFS